MLFSYSVAAIAGSFALALISVLIGEAPARHILGSTVVVAIFGMLIVSVIALPILVATEISKLDNWRFFVVGCAIAAPALFWGLNPKGMEANLLMLPIVCCCGAIAGAVYWCLAWRIFEPDIWPSD